MVLTVYGSESLAQYFRHIKAQVTAEDLAAGKN